MRRTALLLTIVLASGTVAAGAGATTARRAATRTLTIDPATGVSADQHVQATATGFTPGAQLGAAECVAGAIVINQCDATSIAYATADDSGSATFSVHVKAEIIVSFAPVDCTVTGACVVAAAEITDITGTAASAPISFTKLPKPRAGSIEVPSAPVSANQSATVAADGFAARVLVALSTCKHGATSADDCARPAYTYADDNGHAAETILTYATIETVNGNVDCRVDGACDFAAWDARDFTTVAAAPMRVAPAVPGSITVTPATGLRDGDTVTVSGTGWPADTYIEIDECSGDQATLCPVSGGATTEDDGTFSVPFGVLRHSGPHSQYFDCEVDPCSISVSWFPDENTIATATQPIGFAFTPVAVTSHYSADELAAVTAAAHTLEISTARLQRDGSWALAWVLGLSGTKKITPVADNGPKTVKTDWGPDDYAALSPIAKSEGTTVPEFEKTGAILVAYVLRLAGR